MLRPVIFFIIPIGFLFFSLWQPFLAARKQPLSLSKFKSHTSETTSQAEPPACLLYPMTTRRSIIEAATIGQKIDILAGNGAGDYGWLAWNPDGDDENYLVSELNNPQLSLTDYTDPSDVADHLLEIGDYVTSFNGVANTVDVRTSLTALVSQPILVPVWDDLHPDGFKSFLNPNPPPAQVDAYKITGFISVRIEDELDIDLLNKAIYATYLGPANFPCPALTLIKTGPLTATVNSPITYTLTITNTGDITATNLVLTDTIPANATYIGGGALVGNVVSWTIPSLGFVEGANSLSRTFSVQASQTITNNDYLVSADGNFSAAGETSV